MQGKSLMSNINKVSDKEIQEDIRAIMGNTADFNRTTDALNLTEDELLIFKRAVHQLKKETPNALILRKAYDIFIVKSFNNSADTSYDTQAILSVKEKPEKETNIKADTKNIKIVAVFILLIVLYKTIFS